MEAGYQLGRDIALILSKLDTLHEKKNCKGCDDNSSSSQEKRPLTAEEQADLKAIQSKLRAIVEGFNSSLKVHGLDHLGVIDFQLARRGSPAFKAGDDWPMLDEGLICQCCASGKYACNFTGNPCSGD